MFQQIGTELGYWLDRTWTFADVAEHWDATEDYDEINSNTYSYSRRFVDGFELSNLPPDGRILDLCSRTGNGTKYFFNKGKVYSAICADVSTEMGRICNRNVQGAGLSNFTWVPILDYQLPFGSGAFDAVLCFETVEHFPDPGRLIAELGRVTQSGGTLILTTPNVLWEPIHAVAAILKLHHSEGPHRFIRYDRLMKMIETAGFKIENTQTTVLIPGGPRFLVGVGEWLEHHAHKSMMELLGLRRVIVGRRL